MRADRQKTFFLLLGFSILAGINSGVSKDPPCSSTVDNGYGSYADHVVEVDSDGRCGANLKELFNRIARQRRKRIVLYVHGGRVTLERARKTARCLADAIQETDSDAYPIFLNWEAGQGTSYLRHVTSELAGISYRESSSAAIVAIASPMVVVSDIGRAAFRLPINTLLSVGNLLQNCDGLVGRHDHFFPAKGRFDQTLQSFQEPMPNGKPKEISAIYKDGFTYPNSPHDLIPFSVSMGHDARPAQLGFALKFVATLPLQFGTEPILDTVGTPAWNNMVGRTRSMFHPQRNYVLESTGSPVWQDGGAAAFFHSLDHFMHQSSSKGFTLDIYAHSMGTMIVNEAFTLCPDLHVDQIVYMGAACSVRDFKNSAGRYVEEHGIPFYNLSLHPRTELDEVEASGIPVRGSLLVWIDEFFNQPQSFADRTLGTFENAIAAQDVLPHGFNVHLKAFPVEDGKGSKGKFVGPQRHNDFANYYFWRPEFYNTDAANLIRYYSRWTDQRATRRQQ